jgi:hypothetical protein
MAESRVRDDNYFQVSGWMLNNLNLKGAALLVFSIIYGFSQDGEGSFTGSLQYLCDFTNSSKNTVLKSLRELTEKKYIIKTENSINGVRFCTYKVNAPLVQNLNRGGAEIEPGVVQKLNQGGAEIEPNNKDNNKSIISKDIVKEVIDLYHSICVSLPSIRTVTEKRKTTIQARLKTYSLEDFKSLFEKAENSSFLKGVNKSGWNATFDWLINEANMTKVLEDSYLDKPKPGVPGWVKPFEPTSEELEFINRALKDDPP